MSDSSGPKDWEIANKNKAKDAFKQAKEAQVPLGNKPHDVPTMPKAIAKHGMQFDHSPPVVRKKTMEEYSIQDKQAADAKQQTAIEKFRANKARSKDKDHVKSKDDKSIDKE